MMIGEGIFSEQLIYDAMTVTVFSLLTATSYCRQVRQMGVRRRIKHEME